MASGISHQQCLVVLSSSPCTPAGVQGLLLGWCITMLYVLIWTCAGIGQNCEIRVRDLGGQNRGPAGGPLKHRGRLDIIAPDWQYLDPDWPLSAHYVNLPDHFWLTIEYHVAPFWCGLVQELARTVKSGFGIWEVKIEVLPEVP